MKERRKFVRIKSSDEIKYKIVMNEALVDSLSKENVIKSGKSVDIGGGGICIETTEEVKEGTILAIEVKIKELPHPIFALGEVAWIKKIKDKFSVGIKFIRVAENDHYKVFNYVIDKIIKEG